MVTITSTDEKLILNRCIQFKVLEAKRYKETVQVFCMINGFLNEKKDLGKIFLIDSDIKEFNNGVEGREIEIDILIESNNEFIIFEFKTSIRNDENDIEHTVMQIVERDKIFKIGSKTINAKNLVLLCHKDDIEKVFNKYKEMIGLKKIQLSRPLSFFKWGISKDTGDVEKFYIEYYDGDVGKNNFLKELKKGLKKAIHYIVLDCQMYKYVFTNKKPCKQYTLSIFKKFIHSILSEVFLKAIPNKTIKFKKDKLIDTFIEQNSNPVIKPKRKWFKETIDFFDKNLKNIKDLGNGEVEIILDEFRKKISGEFFEFFSEKLCRIEIKKLKKEKKLREKIKIELERKKQKTLFESIK